MFGVKNPKSRRALERPVRYLTNSGQLLKFVVRTCPNKHVHEPVKGLPNAYRSSSCWHTRAVKRLEAYPDEDVEMDLAGTAIHDDEFHEEPQLEETKVSEEVHNAVRWAVMRVHNNLVHAARNCCVALHGLVEPIKLRSELRVNSSATFARRTSLRKVTCLRSWLIRTLNAIKALEWISFERTQTHKCSSS